MAMHSARGRQLRGRRAVYGMETSGLHAIIDSPLAWASRPVRLLQAALREPVAGGKPVNIVQNLSGDLIDGGAEPHYDTDDVGVW
jgi:hypothetical protein